MTAMSFGHVLRNSALDLALAVSAAARSPARAQIRLAAFLYADTEIVCWSLAARGEPWPQPARETARAMQAVAIVAPFVTGVRRGAARTR
jgi:hypothetical protein